MSIDPRLTAALLQFGTDSTGHSGRTLLKHLQGTHDRLSVWGNVADICNAGLFHSIYGTHYFKVQTVAMSRRAEIRDLIGPDAEYFAYLFCVCNRKDFQNAKEGADAVIRDRAVGNDITVPEAMVAQLLEIEVANILDQVPPWSEADSGERDYMRAFFEMRRRARVDRRTQLIARLYSRPMRTWDVRDPTISTPRRHFALLP